MQHDEKNTERLWQVMESTLNEATREQKRRRRWGIFFKFILCIYVLVLLVMLFGSSSALDKSEGGAHSEYTAVIQLNGMIAADEAANADRLITGLKRAFEDPKAKGIIIRINSGGGSPVQSGYVYDEIKRLRSIHDKKVYAVVMETGASGAYYIAAAADEIYADKASLVGSIGVTGASFGFVDAMDKLGIERRLYTSGKHKAFLDPFQPMRYDERDFWQNVLNGVHEQFITAVKEGRGDRLKIDTPDLFSGLIWNGEQALEIGLIDGLGSTNYVAREIIKAPYTVDFTVKEDPLGKIMKRLGAEIKSSIRTSINEFSWN